MRRREILSPAEQDTEERVSIVHSERIGPSANRRSRASSTLQLLALALLTACTHPGATGADGSRTPTPAATDTAPTDFAGKPPFITDNPDGTFTIQKQPSKGGTKNTKDKGLVIPPQVVVPLIPAPKDKRRN